MKLIHTKISEERYADMLKRMNQYGFKSIYEFVTAIICMALDQFDRMDMKHKNPDVEFVDDEIDEMFAKMEDGQGPKYGARNKRTHDPQNKFYDNK